MPREGGVDVPMVRLQVNGHTRVDEVEARLLLVDYLRDRLQLTGTKIGCDTSNCGACTVHLDGLTVKSCTLLAVQADGSKVTTIEGLDSDHGGPSDPRGWHPVQRAFHQAHGLQCGYCTPGMIMSTIDLLREHPEPTEEDIRHGLEGNLCRCTGYRNIVKAVRAASKEMRASAVQCEPEPPQPGPPEPDRVDSPRPRSASARLAPLAGGVLLVLGVRLVWRAVRDGRRSPERTSDV